MTVFDYAVLAIVGLSILLSVIRGLVREVLALVAWVVAFVVANLFGASLASLMPAAISSEELRLLAGFVSVFFAVLLLMSLAAMGLSKLVQRAGLGVEDRMLGALFGLLRGLLVVLVFTLLAGLTSLPKAPVWREAVLSGPIGAIAAKVRQWLPAELARRIKFE